MRTIYLIISMILLTACQNSSNQEEEIPTEGETCQYESHIEQATISSFEYIENQSQCDNAVHIHFTLEESPTIEYTYNMPYSGILTSEMYFESKGLTVGSTHDINVSTITTGTCSPITFEFVDINLSDMENYCIE